jgi:predicted transcriptional regulator
VLWARGPSTVKEVHAAITRDRETGYTTVLKFLQIMYGKRLVARDDSSRTHVYRAAVARDETQDRLVGDLASRAFGGSAVHLALRALSATPATRDELAQIRTLVERLEREKR